jgi:hypothetical protein
MRKDSRINGDFAICWSGRWESTPRPNAGKLLIPRLKVDDDERPIT